MKRDRRPVLCPSCGEVACHYGLGPERFENDDGTDAEVDSSSRYLITVRCQHCTCIFVAGGDDLALDVQVDPEAYG